MIPLVTVTFTNDKWQMLLQAHSLEKFAIEPTTHYVIINDDATSFLEWKYLLEPIYKKNTLVLINKETNPEIFPNENLLLCGYYRQMILKLTIAKLINYNYYVTLDSKNLFHKSVDLNIFDNIEGSGLLLVKDNNNQEYFNNLTYYSKTIELLSTKYGLSIPEIFWFAGTPFVFKTENVLKILDFLNIDEFVYEITSKGGYFSEYAMYNFFSNSVREKKSLVFRYNYKLPLELSLSPSFIIYRYHLNDTAYKSNVKTFLINAGLDEKYIVPALELTDNSLR